MDNHEEREHDQHVSNAAYDYEKQQKELKLKDCLQYANDHFIAEIMEGKYVVNEELSDQYCIRIVTNSGYHFNLWHCNYAHSLKVWNYVDYPSFMQLNFREEDKLPIWAAMRNIYRKLMPEQFAAEEEMQTRTLTEKELKDLPF